MQSLARFAVRQRWAVLGLWLALIVGAQLIAQAAGGAAYKNDFKLPHTEAATVSKLLTNAGLDKQNGSVGTVVLHAKSGTLAAQKADHRAGARGTVCSLVRHRQRDLPFGTVTCARRLHRTAGNPALLSKDGTIGLAQLQFNKPEVLLPAAHAVQKATQTKLNSPRCRSSSPVTRSRSSARRRRASRRS